jgi:isoaspartyl peptidase/L-asparaginase-like protein (Ntn-hydrolase superfamily)
MERTRHVLLAGAGAERFAAAQGHPQLPPSPPSPASAQESSRGTVGAVALDVWGHLAAATSTGGLSGKLPGRVGDSPVIGAGTWADGRVAISGTGEGECFMRSVFAHQVAMSIAAGHLPEVAAEMALAEVEALGGDGGCIVVGRDGRYTLSFITEVMPRAFASPAGRWTAIGRIPADQGEP